MTGTLKFSQDSQWREFQGKRYLNCDHHTEEEMAIIADWHNATKEQRQAICDKNGWHGNGGMYVRVEEESVMTMYVRVRLADVDRTLEWREVEADSLDEAVKVAELMDDVEVVLEASTIPGGVVT